MNPASPVQPIGHVDTSEGFAPLESIGNFYGRVVTYFKTYKEPITQAGSLAGNGVSAIMGSKTSYLNPLLNNDYIRPLKSILKLFISTINTTLGIKGGNGASSTFYTNFIAKARLLIGFSIPCALYSLWTSGSDLYKAKLEQERQDKAYDFLENIGWLGDSIISLYKGLEFNGYLIATPLSPLSAAITFLSTISIIKHGKNHSKSIDFLNQMVEKEKSDVALSLESITKLENYSAKVHFNVSSGSKLKETINKMLGVSKKILPKDINQKEKSDKQLKAVYELLKTRISNRNFSHKLSLLSVAVQMIGLTILIFSSVTPAAFAILSLASAISLYKFFTEKKSVDSFNQQLENLAPVDLV